MLLNEIHLTLHWLIRNNEGKKQQNLQQRGTRCWRDKDVKISYLLLLLHLSRSSYVANKGMDSLLVGRP